MKELYTVTCLAGNGERAVCASEPSPADTSSFFFPSGVQVLADGRFLVVCMNGNCLVTVSADMSTMQRVAGTGESGGTDGAALQATFEKPMGLCVLRDGRALVTEFGGGTVRVLSADMQRVSTVECYEEDVAQGSGAVAAVAAAAAAALVVDGEDEEEEASSEDERREVEPVRFQCPCGILETPDGRVLVSCMQGGCVRVLSADLTRVRTLAGLPGAPPCDGPALEAGFLAPSAIALLPDGERVLVSDFAGNRIRMISTTRGGGEVTTVAGDGEGAFRDGAAKTEAQLFHPAGLSVLWDGRVLIADSNNHRLRLLSADLATMTTVAGDGERTTIDGAGAGEVGGAVEAKITLPLGMSATQLDDGSLIFTEGHNSHRVRRITGFAPAKAAAAMAAVAAAAAGGAVEGAEGAAGAGGAAAAAGDAAEGDLTLGKRRRAECWPRFPSASDFSHHDDWARLRGRGEDLFRGGAQSRREREADDE
jgi:glucose/arabinose dehydrogenase